MSKRTFCTFHHALMKIKQTNFLNLFHWSLPRYSFHDRRSCDVSSAIRREHASDSVWFIFGHPLILVRRKQQHDCEFGILVATGDGDVCRRTPSIQEGSWNIRDMQYRDSLCHRPGHRATNHAFAHSSCRHPDGCHNSVITFDYTRHSTEYCKPSTKVFSIEEVFLTVL